MSAREIDEIARKVETATAADIPALTRLRSNQGWAPSSRLLRVIQAWSGGRVFLLRASALAATTSLPGSPSPLPPEAPIATASAIAAGPVGVIGNVIVRADYRRRGLGRVVMEASLRWLRGRGVRHVLLAATPDGRPLYSRLGFASLETSWFAHGAIAALNPSVLRERAGTFSARPTPAETLRECAAIDAAAFGGDRLGLLELLLGEGETWLYAARESSGHQPGGREPAGYLILRRLRAQRDTLQIGPWVATSPAAAAALLGAILDETAPWRATFAASDEPRLLAAVDRRDALALLVAAGATLVEDDIVMQLDFASPGAPDDITATGGPPQPVAAHPAWLYAWLAPMVF